MTTISLNLSTMKVDCIDNYVYDISNSVFFLGYSLTFLKANVVYRTAIHTTLF